MTKASLSSDLVRANPFVFKGKALCREGLRGILNANKDGMNTTEQVIFGRLRGLWLTFTGP